MSAVQNAKAALRRASAECLRQIDPAWRRSGSADARLLLQGQPVWAGARFVLLYAPMPHEIDVWPLAGEALRTGKRVALPRYDPVKRLYAACELGDLEGDVHVGAFGIREPHSRCVPIGLDQPDLVLVPGVAFDLEGRRLGHGKGYYDRLLREVRGTTCGVAFDEQVVPEIPLEPHDIRMNCLVTPTRWVRFRQVSGLR